MFFRSARSNANIAMENKQKWLINPIISICHRFGILPANDGQLGGYVKKQNDRNDPRMIQEQPMYSLQILRRVASMFNVS